MGQGIMGDLREFQQDMLGFLTRMARTKGDVARYRLGYKPFVLLSHPDYIEEVLVTRNKQFAKHFVLDLLKPTLGNGLLNSGGEHWLRQRRLMQPAFQPKRIQTYAGIMTDHTLRLAQVWEQGGDREVNADMMNLALGIVAESLLGLDMTRESQRVGQAMEVLMEDFSYRFESLFSLPLWLPSPWNRKVKRMIGELDQLIFGLIAQRRHRPGAQNDLLTRLLQARDEETGQGMTDRQLRDELMTLFLAGHETTANSLTWTWYLLSQYPAVAEKLREELRDVLRGQPPTAADVPRLKYLEQVLLESMRIYPPVYAYGRKPVETVEIGGEKIAAETSVIMSQWVVHRDPRFFDDPADFRPERWTEAFQHQLPRYAYFPFSGGPRVCIGDRFAMLEASLVLAMLVPRFRVELLPDPPIVPWPSVTLRPHFGMRMKIHRC